MPILSSAVIGSIATGVLNSAEASKNRQFQEDMSNTSYQRAMRDMELAGLNPMLASKIGGAAVPGGATAVWPDIGSSFTNAKNAETQESQMEANVAKIAEEIMQSKLVQGRTVMETREIAEKIILLQEQAMKTQMEGNLTAQNLDKQTLYTKALNDNKWLATAKVYSENLGIKLSDFLNIFKYISGIKSAFGAKK